MSPDRDNPYCTGELAQQAAARGQGTAAEAPTPSSAGPTAAAPADGAPVPAAPPVDDLAAQNAALREQLLRLAADFDNAKKRQAREQEDARRYGDERLLREILPIVDNLERAVAHSPAEGGGDEPVIAGVRMVLRQFQDFLIGRGVTAITCLGAPFDPERHEAIGQEATGAQPEGSVLHQVQQGYTLHGRLLRPARVVVAVAAAPSDSAG